MKTREFEVTQLKDWDLPHGDVEYDEIYDHTRWSVHHELVFGAPDDGKFYRVYYSVGATEYQDEEPWEYETTVIGHEVEYVEATIKRWENVK